MEINYVEINYDEAKVPPYSLPNPLINLDGTPVQAVADWPRRRAELLDLFEKNIYGKMPGQPTGMWFEMVSIENDAVHGIATRKQVTVHFTAENDGPQMDILLYVPNEREAAAPLFLGLNFFGNQTVQHDPEINLAGSWLPNKETMGVTENRATEQSRGTSASQWPVEQIVKRGYALATIYCGDIDPDFDDGFQNGVHPLINRCPDGRDGQTKPLDDECATIGAWAWGLMRAMDYFQIDSDIDTTRVAVTGHSRLGKTALWAGAQDGRFSMVVSNNSGCGGAALFRRCLGETIAKMNVTFPHWFCKNFHGFNNREAELPVDQHQLLSLIAPRPVYIASAEEDLWADPRGEFLSALHADPVYRLLGTEGFLVDEMPPVDRPVIGRIGYHIRTGEHDITPFDWEQYMNFADHYL